MTDSPKRLTTKQEQFILHYLGDARYNATKAAKMAGYSERTARQSGYENMTNHDVLTRIKAELSARALPAEAVIDELADVATATWGEFVTVRTDPKTGQVVDAKMDLGSKVKALEILAKAHGLLTDRVDLSGSLTNTVTLVGVDASDI
jgi:phage terminase small subunit